MIHSGGGKTYEVNEKLIEYIIKVARGFEAYTAGDIDLAEAKKEVASEDAAPAKKLGRPAKPPVVEEEEEEPVAT